MPAFVQCWHDGKPKRSAGCKASAAHPFSARILVEILGLPPATGQEPQSALTPALIGLLCVAVRRTSTTYRQGHACATPRQTHLKGSSVVCAALSISSRCTSPQPVSSSLRYAAEKTCIVCPSASRVSLGASSRTGGVRLARKGQSSSALT